MSVNRCPYEQKLIEEINLHLTAFKVVNELKSNERQKNRSRSTENCKRMEEDSVLTGEQVVRVYRMEA